jgi:hypothetical protein
VAAARTGGVSTLVQAPNSISKYGVFGYGRTDLGLQNDTQAAQWATFVVQQRAFPRPNVQAIELLPWLDPASWKSILSLRRCVDVVQLKWQPPGEPDVYDVHGRIVGMDHQITRTQWLIAWDLWMVSTSRKVFTLGTHAFDKLNDGNLMG